MSQDCSPRVTSRHITTDRARPAVASRSGRGRAATILLLAGALCVVVGGGGLAGCENDSYMNPGVVGRWENTPTIVPVLDRLAAVEGSSSPDMADFAKVTSEDLIPEVDIYRVDAGDTVEVIINELFNPGAAERFERTVDPRGFIDLPQLATVYVAGMSSDEAAEAIARQYKARKVLNEPVTSVNILARRRLTYNIMGGVTNPGTYQIPRPEFRLLEALTQSGRFQEQTQYVYVIRSVALSDRAAGRFRPSDATGSGTDINQPAEPGKTVTVPVPGRGESVIDLIDSLGAPPSQPQPSPSVLEPVRVGGGQRGQMPMIDIDTVARTGGPSGASSGGGAGRTQPVQSRGSTMTSPGGSRWVFVNGQWVAASSVSGLAGGARGVNMNVAQDILTQRVLRVPLGSLLSGSAQNNVVIRPGDIIRVPSPTEGLVYVEGQVQRPGPYSLPTVGTLTLTRAIVAAGGLGDIAIPERVDITRFVGADRQATVRLNYRAIKEGTQPDLYLRDGDMINVGTNFWALPLAVIRNGFRASYGFGFILDRNFGFDIFGPQQTGINGF